jgi:adenosylcobinamide kinase / adenosylcobinamide-phosphate guanylyltransferase
LVDSEYTYAILLNYRQIGIKLKEKLSYGVNSILMLCGNRYMSRSILVTGPARSGKSEFAERLAQQSLQPITYVATAQRDPQDEEWQQRIERHRGRRPPTWQTLEVPIALPGCIDRHNGCLLVDSLGTWVANLLDRDEEMWKQIQNELLVSLHRTTAEVILVAEETGWGVVPAYPLGRTFRDRLGTLTRKVGAIANPVYLVTGGYALNLSELGSPLANF